MLTYPTLSSCIKNMHRIAEFRKRSSAMVTSVAIYIFVCAWPLFLSSLIKERKIYVTLAFIPYIAVSALRGFRVGTDTIQFTSVFQTIIKADWNQLHLFRYEPLFTIFSKLLGYLSEDPHILVFSSSLFMGICAIYATQKLSQNPILSCCLYGLTLIFFINMNVMRQGMASAIILASLPALLHGNRKRFILFAIIGFLFHYSSIFASCFCYCSYRKSYGDFDNSFRKNFLLQKKMICVLFFILPAVVILLPQLISFVDVDVPYSVYVKNDFYLKFAAHFLVMAPVLIFLIIQTAKCLNSIQRLYRAIFCMELFLLFLANVNSSVSRIVWYFHSLLFLFIPMVVSHRSLQERKQISLEILVFFTIYAVLMSKILLSEWGLFPYEFLWNESIELETSWLDNLI